MDRTNSEPAQRLVVLDTANQVALNILANRTGIEALSHIAEAARTLSGARYGALGVANPDGQGLAAFLTVGLTPDEEASIGPRPRGAGILGLLLQSTSPMRFDNLSDHPSSAGFPPNHPRMTSFLGVPVCRGDSPLGSLYLTDKLGGGVFTEADEVAVSALASHAAVAIHHMQTLERQRTLARGLMFAQEDERRSIAYDLHDGLTQYVMAAHAHLTSFKRAQDMGSAERASRELEQGLSYLKEAVLESRRLVNGLRTLALDDLGLAGAVEQLLNEEKSRAGWREANLIHNIASVRFERSLETAAYRVIQEALTNARKHAASAIVQVSLLSTDDLDGATRLRVEIRDWGCGFVAEEKTGEYRHFGLHGMIERVHLMGGSHSLESIPGEGTVVSATFPAVRRSSDLNDNMWT